MKHLTYSERIPYCQHPLAKKLLQLLETKKTNLALSADVYTATELLYFADLLGPEICILKTHIDTIFDFTPALTEKLRGLADKHNFLIFEDRKFADIGNTVKAQFQGGIYKISDWADVINAHALPGPGMIQGLREVGLQKNRALLLLTEMSSEKNLFTASYANDSLQLAENFPEFVMGFVCQKKLCQKNPAWIYLTPGVQLNPGKDSLGQQYITPELAIMENHIDVIIVGRGIVHASKPLEAAKEYRKRAWDAYVSLN